MKLKPMVVISGDVNEINPFFIGNHKCIKKRLPKGWGAQKYTQCV